MPGRAMISFDELVKLSGWTPDDGDFPGYFRDKPPGCRYIASVVWITPAGPLYPANYAPAAGHQYEREDAIARGGLLAMEADADARTIQDLRAHYPEFAFPWGGRYKYYYRPVYRHGWPRPAWAPPKKTPVIDTTQGIY